MSTLYMVGTPIGNLGDITPRALETFREADVIACEDTRHTLGLLTHFGIRKPLLSCRARNEAAAAQRVTALLDQGKTVAYASDAGTPGLSDPGAVLADAARDGGHRVVPIPGPSAFASLLSAAGQVGKTVVFEGFLSPRAGRRNARLRELMATGWGVLLYESPFRVLKLLAAIADIDTERRVIVGRELTKVHEEILAGSAGEALEAFASREKIQGEFSVLIGGTKNIEKNCT